MEFYEPAIPSFAPWNARIRVGRTIVAALGSVLVFLLAYSAGIGLESSIMRGMASALVLYFVAWALMLVVCDALYHREIQLCRAEAESLEKHRQAQVEAAYLDRLSRTEQAAQGDTTILPKT